MASGREVVVVKTEPCGNRSNSGQPAHGPGGCVIARGAPVAGQQRTRPSKEKAGSPDIGRRVLETCATARILKSRNGGGCLAMGSIYSN